jgi:hypothetical protein
MSEFRFNFASGSGAYTNLILINMTDCYLIGLRVLGGLFFAVGMGLIIFGYRKYGFNPLVFLAPFVGGVLSFPIFFMLRERSLKKSGATADEVRRAHRLTVLGWVFFAAIIVVSSSAAVCPMVAKFDEIQISANAASNTTGFALVWASRLFWSMLTVCAAYAVSLAAMWCRCGKKR